MGYGPYIWIVLQSCLHVSILHTSGHLNALEHGIKNKNIVTHSSMHQWSWFCVTEIYLLTFVTNSLIAISDLDTKNIITS